MQQKLRSAPEVCQEGAMPTINMQMHSLCGIFDLALAHPFPILIQRDGNRPATLQEYVSSDIRAVACRR